MVHHEQKKEQSFHVHELDGLSEGVSFRMFDHFDCRSFDFLMIRALLGLLEAEILYKKLMKLSARIVNAT